MKSQIFVYLINQCSDSLLMPNCSGLYGFEASTSRNTLAQLEWQLSQRLRVQHSLR
jgi:hypothetical protein